MSGNEQPADSAAAAADQPGGPAEPVTSGASLSAGAAPPESGAAPPGSGGASGPGGARRAGRVLTSRAAGWVAAGTVSSVSASGFTLTTGAGQQVTVTEKPSTTYRKAGSPATASAVTRGAAVAVLGSLNGLNITATVVAVQPAAAGFFPGALG